MASLYVAMKMRSFLLLFSGEAESVVSDSLLFSCPRGNSSDANAQPYSCSEEYSAKVFVNSSLSADQGFRWQARLIGCCSGPSSGAAL